MLPTGPVNGTVAGGGLKAAAVGGTIGRVVVLLLGTGAGAGVKFEEGFSGASR
jgi:hypothetical protein